MTDPAARRLVVVGVLRLHVSRVLGLAGLPREVGDDALWRAAASLATGVDTLAGLHRVSFEPPYPGPGVVEPVRHGRRLVLRSTVRDRAGDEAGTTLGVVLTVLIPGREPQVQMVPA